MHGLLFAMWHDIQFQFYACPARASLSGLDASGTGSKSAIKYDYGQFELTLWVRLVEAAKKDAGGQAGVTEADPLPSPRASAIPPPFDVTVGLVMRKISRLGPV